MAIGLVVEDLGIILELNGIIFANILAFILPGWCYLHMQRHAHVVQGLLAFKLNKTESWLSKKRSPGLFLLAFGIVVRHQHAYIAPADAATQLLLLGTALVIKEHAE